MNRRCVRSGWRTSLTLHLSALRLSRLELILPHPMGRKVADKILIQLIEADVEIASRNSARAHYRKPTTLSRTLNAGSNDWATLNLGPFISLLPNCATKLQRGNGKPRDLAFSFSPCSPRLNWISCCARDWKREARALRTTT